MEGGGIYRPEYGSGRKKETLKTGLDYHPHFLKKELCEGTY